MTDFDMVLDECLQKLSSGQDTVESCLAKFTQYAGDLEPLLLAANQVKESYTAPLSDEARARMRTHLIVQMRAHPRLTPATSQRFSLPLRPHLAFGLLGVLIAFLLTGTALAQSAQPGDKLYGWKLASEQAWRFIHPNPLEVDLALIQRRVNELVHSKEDKQNQALAMAELSLSLKNLETYQDEEDRQQIETTLKGCRQALQQAGLDTTELDILFNQKEFQQPTPTPATTKIQSQATAVPFIDETPPLPPLIEAPTLPIPTELPLSVPTLIPTVIGP